MRLGLAAVFVLGLRHLPCRAAISAGSPSAPTAKVLVRAQPSLQQESDYQLAHDAIPGALKTIEGLLGRRSRQRRSPRNPHRGLLPVRHRVRRGRLGGREVREEARRDRVSQRARDPHLHALPQLRAEAARRALAEAICSARPTRSPSSPRTPAPTSAMQMMWAALALGSIINHNLSRVEMLAYQPAR